MVPRANWHHPTYKHKSTVLTNSSILMANVVLGNEDDNPNKTCWIQFLSSVCLLVSLNAETLVVVVVVTGCMAPDHRSPLSAATLWLPLTLNARKRVSKQIWRTCVVIQIKYALPNCVTCTSIRTDPGIPPPGIRTHTGASDTVWQLILNLYNRGFLAIA